MNKLIFTFFAFCLLFSCNQKITKQTSQDQPTVVDSVWVMQKDGNWKNMPKTQAETEVAVEPKKDSVWVMQADGSWKNMPKTQEETSIKVEPKKDGVWVKQADGSWKQVPKAQNVSSSNSDNDKRYSILNPGKKYYYKAIQKDRKGNLLSQGEIGMIATGKIGKYQNDDPTYYMWEMNYTKTDSINLYEKAFTESTREWVQYDTTAASVNEKRFYIHPIRENQYFKLEVAPHPQVKFPIDSFHVFESKVMIFKTFGIFDNSQTNSLFEYQGTEKRSLPIGDLQCHKYTATALNSKVGTSLLEFYYNEDYGFVEKYYTTYDGEEISFKLDRFLDDSIKK